MTVITKPVHATGTLTSTGVQVTAADTATVGSVTYTFVATAGVTANEVEIGADAAGSLQNLFDAINATAAQSGVTHGSATVENPDAIATAVTATTVVVKAKVPGTVGNFIPSTEAATTLSWGAATLASGTGSVTDSLSLILSGSQLNAEVEQLLRWLDESSAAN